MKGERNTYLLNQKQSHECKGFTGLVHRETRVSRREAIVTSTLAVRMCDTPQETCKKYSQTLNSLRVQNRIRTKRHNILHPPNPTRLAGGKTNTQTTKRTFIGVIISSTFFVFNSNTPFKIEISSSLSGSSPVL